jgi:hypothetical protein
MASQKYGPTKLLRQVKGVGPGPLRVRIEARQHGWRRAKLLKDLERNESIYFLWIGKPTKLSERSWKSGGTENTSLDTQTHLLRNEAQLNCVSLRSSLDSELGGEPSRVGDDVA